ncbi:hypothetical protein WDU94_012606 [Cyamophila willieti]
MVHKEYNLDLSLDEDITKDLEMIPLTYYNRIKEKIKFLKLKPKTRPKRVKQKKRKYKIVEMLKQLWSGKTFGFHYQSNQSQGVRKAHKSILTLHNVHNNNMFQKMENIQQVNKQVIEETVSSVKENQQEFEYLHQMKQLGQVTEDTSITNRTMIELEESIYYEDLRQEYEEQLRQEMQQKQVFNFTNNANKTIKEKLASSIKKPKNCTQESWTAIGLTTLKCLGDDLKHANGSMKAYYRVFKQFGRLVIAWTVILGAIVTTLWCWRGKFERVMCGLTRKDRVRNEKIRETVKVGPLLGKKIQESRMRWFGHVDRRDECNIGKQLEQIVIEGKRKRGWPKLRWRDKVEEDLREKGWRRV